MVTKLLCLSIWMSVSMLAMEEGQQELVSTDVPKKDKMPKLCTTQNNEQDAEKIRAKAFKEGLIVGRKEGEEKIKALQGDQKLLLEVLTSKSDMNVKLTNDILQLQQQLQMFENSLAEVTQKFHQIIVVDAEFRINPTKQVVALQTALEELKKVVL